jgi:hypothetical protein
MPPSLDPLACAVFVIAAFIPAGLAHSLWLRSPWAARCRIPIDGGLTWRDRRLLGDNKTWAGFVVLPPITGLTFGTLRWATESWNAGLWPLSVEGYALLGCWTGVGFMAGELPNSFIKRQCGVAPGAAPVHWGVRLVCFLIDRLDSIAGAFLAQAVVVPVGVAYAVWLLLMGPGLHWLFSVLLFALGVKGRPS